MDKTKPLVGRYPADALRADYLRSGAGLALTLGPFAIALPHPVILVPLLLGAGLFGLFGLRTAARQMTRFHMDQDGLRAEGPLGGAIRWSELSEVRLRYFSTRRDRKEGWMQLSLKGGGRGLELESALDGFEAIAARVAEAAIANRLRLAEATRDNFAALGHAIPDPNRPPQHFRWGTLSKTETPDD